MSQTPEWIRDELDRVATEAGLLRVELSDDDSHYDIHYISEKITKCSTVMERLSDIAFKLMEMNLLVTKQVSAAKTELRQRDSQYRDCERYRQIPASDRKNWLVLELEVYNDRLENWHLSALYLREVREAVNDRLQLIKRLDSDVRLHQKLVEAKALSGPNMREPGTESKPRSPNPVTDGDTSELIEID